MQGHPRGPTPNRAGAGPSSTGCRATWTRTSATRSQESFDNLWNLVESECQDLQADEPAQTTPTEPETTPTDTETEPTTPTTPTTPTDTEPTTPEEEPLPPDGDGDNGGAIPPEGNGGGVGPGSTKEKKEKGE